MTLNGGNPVADRLTNLPAHLPSLIGREDAIAQVRERLLDAERGLLTLTGTGGSGKTSLALAVAREVLDSMEFPDGVWLAELAPLGDALLVPGAIASAVGVKEQTGRPIRDTLLEELRLRTLLVLLDNCEHQVETCAALADDLLRTCPGVRILATSREPLRVHGERVWRVPPLSTPDPLLMVAAAELEKNPAVRLFAERARAVQSSFRLSAETSQAVAAICVRLDGLPLAIELAAARARVLTPPQILARLDDAFRLLIGGSGTAPTRQQTLRATLDWSYRLLDEVARRRFESLAVFAAGFDLEAAEAIWADDDDAGADALDMLTALVDRSLVTVQPQAGAMRYRLLEPCVNTPRHVWSIVGAVGADANAAHGSTPQTGRAGRSGPRGTGPPGVARPSGAGARQCAGRAPPLPRRRRCNHCCPHRFGAAQFLATVWTPQ